MEAEDTAGVFNANFYHRSFTTTENQLAEINFEHVNAATRSLQELVREEFLEDGEQPPSEELVDWAYEVLVSGVFPKARLKGLKIVPFHGELHATFRRDNKKLVVFLPSPRTVKLYKEEVVNGRVNSTISHATNKGDVVPALDWLFS
jgi:hypothetical protein